MRVVTNEKLAQRNRKLAQRTFIVSLGVLLASCLVINLPLFIQDSSPLIGLIYAFAPLIVLPVAFVLTILSVRLTNFWMLKYRVDKQTVLHSEEFIQHYLKGLGNTAVLYNYYHFPARHVLISPQGVFAIVTRYQKGKFSVNESRWRTQMNPISRIFSVFRADGIGNPTLDALAAAEYVQQFVTPINPNIQVQPIVLFLSGEAQLDIDNPTVPVLYAKTSSKPSFKDHLRKIPKDQRDTLSAEDIEQFEALSLAPKKGRRAQKREVVAQQ